MSFDAEPFIAKMMRTLKKTGSTILTVEYDHNHIMITRTYLVDEIKYLLGSCLFLYQGEEVFYWCNQKYYRIYEGASPDLDFIVERLPTVHTKDELRKVVDRCYEEYGYGYNYFGSGDDVDEFADEYYLSDDSRRLLHLAVLEKKQENYVKKYGYENPRFNMLMEEYR